MPTSDRLESRRPYDGSLLWQGAVATEAEVAAAVARARMAQRGWGAASLDDRLQVVRAFRAVVEAEAEAFARLIAEETGKPFWEAKTEVGSVAAKVEISIQAHAERTGSREAVFKSDPKGATQALRHKPHGVLAVLGPYNFPAHLPNGHIVPALIAGNAIVFKPSEQTPAVGAFMAGLWAKAGLPDGVLEVVQGFAATGRALAGADVDGLLFTGSAPTGAALARQYAETPGRILALEMGGNNPLLVWDAADVEAVALIVAQSAFLSAGQRCTCARRLIVEDGQHAALLDAVVALADRLRIDEPFAEPQPFMGCVISDRAADGLLTASQAIGGKTIRPLLRLREGLPFLTPGIVDVTGVDVPDTELFGPFLQIVRVKDFDAAIAAANDTRFGLSAALLGGDRALYERFWAGSRAGVVNWNRPTNGAASNAPFGGIGLSGNHRPSAYYAADYCAWPVASVEAEAPFIATPVGIADA
ncbi:succinylglutamate-semialdehyde dehydrogenase [Sandaracinobacteroides hominis]|uniref:succinylglutamate-semialdehyde dehydrogenase n=1 Tax=Sandaracinobacteroides hominis TaxID=2780086 RepID=UPI0018F4F121|nr:succinylglutamate-semialdehyde dehydrogenase [Sandaracinobacteroides hominis]